jgi:hypothetical protein
MHLNLVSCTVILPKQITNAKGVGLIKARPGIAGLKTKICVMNVGFVCPAEALQAYCLLRV